MNRKNYVNPMITTDVYKTWEKNQLEKFNSLKAKIPEALHRVSRGLALDIGCGNGLFQKEVSGNFIGIDPDEKMLRRSVSIFPAVLGNGNNLPFSDYSFDSVISFDTMHLVEKRDFSRVLKPGGLVIFSVFFNDDNFHERREMLLHKVNGFTILEEFTINTKEKEFVVVAEKPAF